MDNMKGKIGASPVFRQIIVLFIKYTGFKEI